MKVKLQNVLPEEIEKRSFEMIEEELKTTLDPLQKPIIKRCIHTTADFEYETSMCFSEHAVEKAMAAIKDGAMIVTDTNMGKAGINKARLAKFGGEVQCFMADDDVRETAKARGITRAVASMEKAAKLSREQNKKIIFAIGNAPTALVRLYELIEEGEINPELVIGVPVGFVNVVESKELIMQTKVPYIVARGRKGGSNVAAAICNALIYMMKDE
ncbi:MAG: precorrin-8X methylmutase [bacterium]|nr:precorrin-8X methylmutase [bacterium]